MNRNSEITVEIETNIIQHGRFYFIIHGVLCPECESTEFIPVNNGNPYHYKFACLNCGCQWTGNITEKIG